MEARAAFSMLIAATSWATEAQTAAGTSSTARRPNKPTPSVEGKLNPDAEAPETRERRRVIGVKAKRVLNRQ